MKIANKYFMCAVALVVGLVVAIAVIVNGILTRAPDVSKQSPSGQYLIESVPASSLLTPRDSVYLRFTDRDHPDQTYRTPLFSELSLDMRADEDAKTVGIIFIELDKESKKITLGLSNPRRHWLDFFISNTPYEIIDN
ncbi:hypothetical protein [Pseudomonas sp. ANT_J28]|uniref:hypothetical protein n=1 Tax=Pseudomonas sp. ANT_J28 TaxID=2597352 RepID=UPI0011F20042|nr:hypothetical protein [Pseudomonas sp. ANT_J28]KAA0979112.1 hypothetical protein FQ187_25120 [Pseudomonas sp. ANT_J28]